MALTSAVKTDLYRFFAVAFDAAPGVTYMNQLAEAADAGMTIPEIVEVFTTKTQFTSVYPIFYTNNQFATKLVENVVGASATAEAKAEAVADIEAALALGGEWTRGKVIYEIFDNLANKPVDDATWGNTAQLLANQVAYAQYYTEELLVDTTDLAALRAVIADVTATSSTAGADIAAALTPAPVSQTFTLTTGATDNVVGGAGADLIIGQVTASDQPTAANTLHASDTIDGFASIDTLRVIGSDGEASVTGFQMTNVENLEIRSYGESLTLGLVNVTGLEKVTSTTSTGDIILNGVQNVVALDLTGNGSSTISVDVNYATDAVAATDDTQAIAVNRFDGIVTVNDVENVTITTAGLASSLEINGSDMMDVTVTGDQDLELDAYTGQAGYHSLEAAEFTGDLNVYIDVDASTDAVVNTGIGSDTVDIDNEGGDGTLAVNVGEGNNDVIIDLTGEAVDLTVVAGSGDDNVEVYGDWNNDATIDITLGAGDDSVYLDYGLVMGYSGEGAGSVTIAGGDGNDELVIAGFENDVIADGSFANITSIETLRSLGEDDQSGSFDGVLTGANAAGVVNYIFEGNSIDDALELTNVVNNVTVTLEDQATDGYDFTLSVDSAVTDNTAATINVMMSSGSSDELAGSDDYGMRVNNIQTLNFHADATDAADFTTEELMDSVSVRFGGLSGTTLETINFTGNAYFYSDSSGTDMNGSDFNGISADNLSLIDASALNGSLNIEIDNASDDGLTVLGGNGDDYIYLHEDIALTAVMGEGEDTVYANDSADTIDGGAGDDEIYTYAGDDVIHGGEGNDEIYAGSGLDTVYGDAGNDYIEFDAADLSASDVIDGGEGSDWLYINGSKGTVDDNFFYKWSSVETLQLSGDANNLTLGAIAHDAGLETVFLANSGSGDTLILNEGFTTNLNVYLGNGNDTVTDNLTALNGGVINLTVYAEDLMLSASDTLTATADEGASMDSIVLFGNNGGSGGADLSGVTGFEKLTVSTMYDDGVHTNDYSGNDITIYAGTDDLMTGDGVFTVDASALVDVVDGPSAGSLSFSGGDETGGTEFVITGGEGADLIAAGVNNDTVNGGAGEDQIFGDDGDDTIDGGADDDMIIGGLGSDTLTGGDGLDTFSYDFEANHDESFGGVSNIDTILDFVSGDDVFHFALTKIGTGGVGSGFKFVGNAETASQVNTMLSDDSLAADADIEAVFIQNENTLYIDLDNSGAISAGDAAINLTGVTTLDAADFTTTLVV